jgi:hypothetical protein
MSIEVESQEDLVKEALRVVRAAQQEGITLRLLGGIAFRLKCPSSLAEKLKRNYGDIDFIGHEKERGRITKLFARLGYVEPRTMVNTLNWYRIILENPHNKINVDIFLDVFDMSHKLKFRDRIALEEPTIPLADLLLTKLQAFEFTEREYRDVFALIKDYDLTDKDGKGGINGSYIAKLCGKDWGLCTTVTLNLERLRESVASYLSPQDQMIILDKLRRLEQIITDKPKSLKWRFRAIIGKRMRWYETPQEIQRNPEAVFT